MRVRKNLFRKSGESWGHDFGAKALFTLICPDPIEPQLTTVRRLPLQELSEHLGLRRLNERLSDPIMQDSFDGIFPKDNPKNTRFAINFFTSIGLGGLTDSLREYLKNMPRLIMQQQPALPSDNEETDSSSEDTSSGSGSSGSDTSTESDSSESESSDEDEKRRRSKKSRRDSK